MRFLGWSSVMSITSLPMYGRDCMKASDQWTLLNSGYVYGKADEEKLKHKISMARWQPLQHGRAKYDDRS